MKAKQVIWYYSLRDRWRKWLNFFMISCLFLLSLMAAVPFLFIIYYVFDKGVSAINWNFFTQLPKPPGEEGGGMANALIGSAVVVGMASIVGIPWGMGMGVYLSEYKSTKTAKILRFVIDLLISAPSIVVGIFIYGLIVIRYGFSSYAGAAALLLIMLPIVARGTEEILKMIPNHIREAGLALGIPRWKVIIRILIPSILSMCVTVIMLAIARIAGETAPLLFTSLGNQYHIRNLNEPIATLPVQIYEFSNTGFEQMEKQAWAGAMVLVFFVFFINFFTRLFLFFCKKDRVKLQYKMRK
ncbi:MAG: phosphate ABC transporter permease PstA [Bdellovibrionales bacterium]|nr:phosphate ABC transporter permease PstA [Bdellovibrionales bacterium]